MFRAEIFEKFSHEIFSVVTLPLLNPEYNPLLLPYLK